MVDLEELTDPEDVRLVRDMIARHVRFTGSTLGKRVLDNWDAIQAVAADVPEPEQVASWLRTAGGPGSVAELGLTPEEQHLAEQYSHYLRDRFTVRKLMRTLGLMDAA